MQVGFVPGGFVLGGGVALQTTLTVGLKMEAETGILLPVHLHEALFSPCIRSGPTAQQVKVFICH